MTSTMMRGLWKPIRIILRLISWIVLSWFLLLLLWLFLPYPSLEHDGDNGVDYASRILRAGRTLTRVYNIPSITDDRQSRCGVALDYKLHIHNLTLSVSGTEVALSNPNSTDAVGGPVDATQNINVTARVGDDDGANLPWFPMADSILLSWWIHKESATIPLKLQWSTEESGALEKLALWPVDRRLHFNEPLLVIERQPNDTSKIIATAPARPTSSSPSLTYPLRIAIIRVLAPSAVFINDLLVDKLLSLLIFFGHLSFAVMVVCGLRFCLGRRTLHESISDRMQRVSQNSERLLRIAVTRRRPNQRQNNEERSEGTDDGEAKDGPSTLEAENANGKVDLEKGALDR